MSTHQWLLLPKGQRPGMWPWSTKSHLQPVIIIPQPCNHTPLYMLLIPPGCISPFCRKNSYFYFKVPPRHHPSVKLSLTTSGCLLPLCSYSNFVEPFKKECVFKTFVWLTSLLFISAVSPLARLSLPLHHPDLIFHLGCCNSSFMAFPVSGFAHECTGLTIVRKNLLNSAYDHVISLTKTLVGSLMLSRVKSKVCVA